jgi:hypothetical protein
MNYRAVKSSIYAVGWHATGNISLSLTIQIGWSLPQDKGIFFHGLDQHNSNAESYVTKASSS